MSTLTDIIDSDRELRSAMRLIEEFANQGRFNPRTGRYERIFADAFTARLREHFWAMLDDDRLELMRWLTTARLTRNLDALLAAAFRAEPAPFKALTP